MKKLHHWHIATVFISLVVIGWFGFKLISKSLAEQLSTQPTSQTTTTDEMTGTLPLSKTINTQSKLSAPISDALARVTKKPFGIEIHPQTSPVENDRFDGFHVGVDFEIFEDETDAEVPIMASCDGSLIMKTFAKGYGGVAVQECEVDGQKISVIYGHLNLASIKPEQGEALKAGQYIGLLGQGNSEETDGVRKHLHFGLRKNSEPIVDGNIDIRGYVKDRVELDNWLNVIDYIQE